jgi:predicted phosphodiesterase
VINAWVFSVEDTTVQVTWRDLGAGPIVVRAGDTRVEVDTVGGPGSALVGGLEPGRTYTVTVDTPTRRGRPLHRQITTLRPPPGEELFRFATVSDLHLGTTSFGHRKTLVERPVPAVPHPARASAAALDELTTWGAQLLLVKGDLTNRGRQSEWDELDNVLRPLTMPVELTLGNHDVVYAPGRVDARVALARQGRRVPDPVHHLDVPGLRIIMTDTTRNGLHGGRVHHLREPVAELAAAAEGPVFVVMHHYLMRLPFPTFWPPGITSLEALPFARALAAANPATMLTSGHTHRHRRHHLGPLVLTEVGSPKDFPGTWAGYVVHEGGIRQVVRRVSRPDVLAWTDYTARAAFGLWGLWSPGARSHRCFSHTWPSRPG